MMMRRARGGALPTPVALVALAACSTPPPPSCSELSPAATGTTLDAAREAHRRAAVRQELRYREALEPNYTLRTTAALAADESCPGDLIEIGRLLFEHPFTHADGLAPFMRVHDGDGGGADATSCVNCHWRGGPGGAGGLPDDSYILGDGDRVTSADARNPPSLVGAGAVELVAAEMTAELLALRDRTIARARRTATAQEVELVTKGVTYGVLHVSATGVVDPRDVAGIDRDLVVRPFGWKGTAATIEEFIADSTALHLGVRTLHPRQLAALALYTAALEQPIDAPYPATDGTPYERDRWAHGRIVFDQIGCANCHVPQLVLETPVLTVGGTALDLTRDAEAPRLAFQAPMGGYPIALYSDLKRHDLGDDNASRHRQGGIATRLYLTRRLWGLADSAPYFYDGEAASVDYAIERHGGDGAFAREGWHQLTDRDRGDLRLFLLALRRAPRASVP